MSSIERQNNEIQTELVNCQNNVKDINDDTQSAPIITTVEGGSGTLYQNISFGNDIPNKLVWK